MWASKEKETKYDTVTTSKTFLIFIKEKFEYIKKKFWRNYPKLIMKWQTYLWNSKQINSFRIKKHYEINLILESTSSHAKHYRFMSEKELTTVKKYIDEHLKKRFIKFNFLSVSSPVFLTRKSKKKFRFCVDYRGLNALTIKNRYLISLLTKILSKFYNVKMLTKLNVIHTFNKIKIKKGHK